MIRTHGVGKVFNAGCPNEFIALSEVSITLNLHQVTILKGPSGSGKTTLLGIVSVIQRYCSKSLPLSSPGSG